MSLIAYILSSVLLSWIGAAAYLVFRRFWPLGQAPRLVIWLGIGLSLLLPLGGGLGPERPVATQAAVSAPQSVHDFCHCAQPGAGDVIRYHSSQLSDAMLAYRPLIWAVFAVLLGLVLLRFGIGLLRLGLLTRRNAAEWITVEGQRVRLVRGVPGLRAGALRLGGRFIFWHDALDALDPQERRAILLHELSHIRQYNTYERLVLGLVQAIWFWNPAYYFFRRELERLSEYTADRFVVQRIADARAYARLLLRFKTDQGLAMVSLFKGGELKRRVGYLLQPPRPAGVRVGMAFGLCVALLLPSELLAERMIASGIREIAVYEFLTAANHETGKKEFCRKCTYEAVEACY
jgi:BlaR1 peptidase M56